MWVLVLGTAALAGCSGEVTPAVMPGVDSCANCSMVIDQVSQAAGWIEDGQFVTFDSPGCLLARHEALRQAGEPFPEELFFADFHSGEFHPVSVVTFLLTSHRPTVMDNGALAFASRAEAEAARAHDDEVLVDWTGYRTARGTPDREVEVILDHDPAPIRVEVNKGELVKWTVRCSCAKGERRLAVEGYPELEPVRVLATGEPVSFQLLATRPGSGFPIMDRATGEILGTMVVRGPHTVEEEAEAM